MNHLHVSNVKHLWAALTDIHGEKPVGEGCRGAVLSFTKISELGETKDYYMSGYAVGDRAMYLSEGEDDSGVYARRSSRFLLDVEAFLDDEEEHSTLVCEKKGGPGEEHERLVDLTKDRVEEERSLFSDRNGVGVVMTATTFNAEARATHVHLAAVFNAHAKENFVWAEYDNAKPGFERTYRRIYSRICAFLLDMEKAYLLHEKRAVRGREE